VGPTRDKLTAGEWALLGLLDQKAAHGFALARAMAPDGEVARIWSIRRTMVYSALDHLERWALVQPKATVPSDSGPLLMLKLLFLTRRGENVAPLLSRQREVCTAQAHQLASAAEDAAGFDRALLLWRLHSTRAVIEFTHAMLTDPASSIGDPRSPVLSVNRA
jgi:DNA-binding PadR family transcriptional regulator